MIKLMKNNKGMTFVELMVGLLIFVIIATSVTAILAPTLNIYAKSNDLAEINTILNNLSDEILSELWRATDVAVSGTEMTINTNMGRVVYDIGSVGSGHDGLLCKDRGTGMTPVFEQRYYKGKTVDLKYYTADGTQIANGSFSTGTLPSAFMVRIILRSDETSVSRDYAVKPLGLNQY